MRSTPLRRRLTYGVLSGGLIAGVLVPLSASAASCASWADDAGDATTRQSGVGVLRNSSLDTGGAAVGYDGAATPVKPVVGTACTFLKGAPKPAAAPAASPGASASASPSASASASPSGSPEPSGSASPAPSGSASPQPSGSASPSPSGPPPPPEPTVPVPAAGCVGFSDAAADARSAAGPVVFGNDPDLDIVSVTGRTTEDTISGHLGITKLGSPKFPISGHRFEYEFTAAGKKIVLRASGPGVGTGLVDGSATADLSVSAVFDQVSSQVVLTVDRASLVKVLAAPLPDGAVFTKTAGRSYAQTPVTTTLADTASPEDEKKAVYVVGDNECFRPKMSVTAPAQVQTSDIAFVSIGLVTSDGRIAKEQTVIGRIGTGRAVTAITDEQGTATLAVPVTSSAGVTELVVRSSGEAGEGELRTTVRVLVERTLLTVSRSGTGSTRTLTASLADDDRRRLAGQKVTFSFGGRSVTASTDRNGRAVATVPAGSAVDVVFAGRPGFLSAAKVRTTA